MHRKNMRPLTAMNVSERILEKCHDDGELDVMGHLFVMCHLSSVIFICHVMCHVSPSGCGLLLYQKIFSILKSLEILCTYILDC